MHTTEAVVHELACQFTWHAPSPFVAAGTVAGVLVDVLVDVVLTAAAASSEQRLGYAHLCSFGGPCKGIWK